MKLKFNCHIGVKRGVIWVMFPTLFFSVQAFAQVRTSVTSTVDVTPTTLTVTQSDYRWYENVNAVTPTAAHALENAATTTPETNTVFRLRMNLLAEGLSLPTGSTFKLQFSNSTSTGFTDVGTSTGAWIFANNAGVADGLTLPTTLLTDSDQPESYGESNPTAASPNVLSPSERGEWDWVIANNAAATSSAWYFRMIYSSSTALDAYARYPTLSAAPAPSSGGAGGGSGGSGGGSFLVGNYTPGTSTRRLPPELEPLVPPTPCDNEVIQRIDLNYDCKVDLIDLSILLYYYEQTGPGIARYDFNENSLVDFPDVSIMMFYWTT